eukprot:scaffold121523_cov19-Tisochrysis_lutea.AAC.2
MGGKDELQHLRIFGRQWVSLAILFLHLVRVDGWAGGLLGTETICSSNRDLSEPNLIQLYSEKSVWLRPAFQHQT